MTKQLTLTGEESTRVVNQKHTDKFDVDIGRQNGGSDHMNNTETGEPGWIGNPYPESEYGREECIERFRKDFVYHLETDEEFREAVDALEGKTLGCYCKPAACHGDIIVEYLRHGLSSIKDEPFEEL